MNNEYETETDEARGQRIAAQVQAQLDNLFSYHRPFGDQPTRYEKLRAQGKGMAAAIFALVPDSNEKWNALDKLREALMWANAGIAVNESEPAPEPAQPGEPVPSVAAPVAAAAVEPEPAKAGAANVDGDGRDVPPAAEAAEPAPEPAPAA